MHRSYKTTEKFIGITINHPCKYRGLQC